MYYIYIFLDNCECESSKKRIVKKRLLRFVKEKRKKKTEIDREEKRGQKMRWSSRCRLIVAVTRNGDGVGGFGPFSLGKLY